MIDENAVLKNLTHALENIWLTQSKYTVHKEVAISQVFQGNTGYEGLFYKSYEIDHEKQRIRITNNNTQEVEEIPFDLL